MKVAITGHTKGLGKELSTKFDSVVGFSSSNGYDISSPYDRADMMVRIEGCNVFINNAHSNFHQTELFMDVFEKWKYKEKTIVNIISRSKHANISKGFLYSTSKASLSHLSNSLKFNTDKRCRIIDINPGLLDSDLPSLTNSEMADIIVWCINQPQHIEIGEISAWNTAPYVEVQREKAKRLS
jgi:NADP-dependent 3-hydroxy acid dehydrogenase YdfG